jgi:hypothetical protein
MNGAGIWPVYVIARRWRSGFDLPGPILRTACWSRFWEPGRRWVIGDVAGQVEVGGKVALRDFLWLRVAKSYSPLWWFGVNYGDERNAEATSPP